ncbi:core-2/I-branching enzyme-domain-containing protein [Pavlovales sp. CCMP2436]|nr:core-2/I-branching enzyme-domain-containing protein [Pavlovales sp. CCMP2436]
MWIAMPRRGLLVALLASAYADDAGGWRPQWRDYEGRELTSDGCTAAVRAAGENPEPPAPTVERVLLPTAPRAAPLPSGLRAPVFAFFVMTSRPFADLTVSRMLSAASHPRHLWLLHADLKTEPADLERLRAVVAPYSNAHLMAKRRHVMWGGFSMVDALLDALTTALHGVSGPGWRGFDFFVNLSDTDLLLRTEAELSAFFAPLAQQQVSFVGVKMKGSDPMRWDMHAHLRKLTFLQCDGAGYAMLNATPADLFPNQKRCCYGRSGQIIYGRVPFALPRPAEDAQVFHGSQWVVLHASHAAALLTHPNASAAVRGFRYTFLSDEAVVQTALMATGPELRARLRNHNLRYIDWPHGYGNPEQYWREAGEAHDGGPVMLSFAHAATLFQSEAISARKADPTIDGGRLFALWDAWMAHKLAQPLADQRALGYRLGAAPAEEAHLAPHPFANGAQAAAAAAPLVAAAAQADAAGAGSAQPLVSQPRIAASLLAERADLSHLRVPPGAGEYEALLAAGATPHAARAELDAREASLQSFVPHYGHVDNVTHYYLEYFRQVAEQNAQHAAAAGPAAAADPPAHMATRPLQQPLPPPPRPPLRPPTGAPRDSDAPSTGLAAVRFVDGLRCECETAGCRARATCCDDLLGPAGRAICSYSYTRVRELASAAAVGPAVGFEVADSDGELLADSASADVAAFRVDTSGHVESGPK